MRPLEHWRVVVDVLHVHHQGHVVGQRGRRARVPGHHRHRQPVHRLVVQPVDQADRAAVVVHLEVRRFLCGRDQLVVHLAVGPGIRVGRVGRVNRRAGGHVFRHGYPYRARVETRRIVVSVLDRYAHLKQTVSIKTNAKTNVIHYTPAVQRNNNNVILSCLSYKSCTYIMCTINININAYLLFNFWFGPTRVQINRPHFDLARR